jgi:hypothetical protein
VVERTAAFSVLLLFLAASNAAALELDTLLPTDVPGYGTAQGVSILSRVHPDYSSLDINIGGLSFEPSINAGGGYDSSPNGAANGSGTLSLIPSILAQDTQLGLGAYIAGNFLNYPSAPTQNTAGYTIALGERAVLPRETITLAAAMLSTQETAFGLDTVTLSQPVTVTVKDLRGSDKIILGMLTLTPQFSASEYGFEDFSSQDRTDYRQSLNADFAEGGPERFVALLHATESQYRQSALNANSYEALAGIADDAPGLWQIRLLAGAATRQAVIGKPITAPVLEASVSWMPGDLDSLSLSLAREIDDPDQVTAAGYTLTQADFTLAHEYLRNVIFTYSAEVSKAVYFDQPLVETLFNTQAAVNWHLNRALALNATYAFNDRQANFLSAVNEHIITLGMTWTP